MSHENHKSTFKEFLVYVEANPHLLEQRDNSELYSKFPTVSKDAIRRRKVRAKKLLSEKKQKKSQISQSLDNSSPESETQFIDDPDELLFSVAIRELNKQTPDPRWANILINCIKEKINIKSEALEQFKQLPTQTLVNLLNESLQEERE